MLLNVNTRPGNLFLTRSVTVRAFSSLKAGTIFAIQALKICPYSFFSRKKVIVYSQGLSFLFISGGYSLEMVYF